MVVFFAAFFFLMHNVIPRISDTYNRLIKLHGFLIIYHCTKEKIPNGSNFPFQIQYIDRPILSTVLRYLGNQLAFSPESNLPGSAMLEPGYSSISSLHYIFSHIFRAEREREREIDSSSHGNTRCI